LAEHFGPEGFMLPINIMVVDQKGEAFRIFIGTDRKATFH
jgi:hypothetical protein